MTAPLLMNLGDDEALAGRLAGAAGLEPGKLERRRFPDGESYLRFDTDPAGCDVVILCSLDCPDEKFLPLLFTAAAARDLGARSVGLVSPYLAYMRQDRRFKPGEAVTSRYFAQVLGHQVDWLVTVDPHLHRYESLSEIYEIPAEAVHASAPIAAWIGQHVEAPLLIGPDEESRQWASAVAEAVGAPHIVLKKTRRGDRDIQVSVPDVSRWRDHTPVLVDDIVSTAHTMAETVRHLVEAGLGPPVCIAVHGLFAEDAETTLRSAGAGEIVSTNTVTHGTNGIDVSALLGEAVGVMLGSAGKGS